ncbi:phytoene desaturase family protein [Reichenbachiella agarivorans]|uniref:Phytoene desaturase family protein n=1 Tax=Reichenbachiella agarivorans TaxID=2979464 RepID=A0ABY6CNP5_9BACT|nr:phytoene desaturase family protein [Reichenbachiella agarivorans]UXP32135.1 phytoene desaturase family protein [Reichenbachiella agarivorans]
MSISNSHKITVLGAGFAGLSAAAVLSQHGAQVDLFEKNSGPGGRCRVYKEQGFTFDMGPSWYWMPDVLEKFLSRFDKSISDYFDLIKLDPGFRIYFGRNEFIDIPNTLEEQKELFESLEPGSGVKLEKFLKESKIKYDVGISDLVYKPSYSIMEFFSFDIIYKMIKMNALQSIHSYLRKSFKHPYLLSLLEFPVLFLGGTAKSTPSLYSLMNYSCLSQGTYYPMGGFYKVTESLYQLAQEQGVNFHFDAPVDNIDIRNHSARSIHNGQTHHTDGIVSSLDYHFLEKEILKTQSNYSEKYWNERTMSPSALIFYLGVKGKVKNLIHHNLFFDEDFDEHARDIYEDPKWPQKPLFYVCCPSKTDDSVAPEEDENLFILMPLATGITDNEAIREEYYQKIISRLERIIDDKISDRVIVKKSYCINDFKEDYNSFKGNAYGLANTLGQTAMFKPSMKSKNVKNLFHCGQLTVPGPGVPPAIISGQLAASQLLSYLNNTSYEKYL